MFRILSLALVCTVSMAATSLSAQSAQDRVVLKSGRIIEGAVIRDDAERVAIAFDFGGSVEFARADVRRVVKGTGTARAKRPTEDREPAGIDWRFMVYHGEEAVGFRTYRLKPGVKRHGRSGTLAREEISFLESTADGPAPCRVVTIEFTSDDGAYRTLYYREMGMGTDSIVDGRWRDGELRYTWFRGGKRTYHRTPLAAAIRFPLAHWAATNATGAPAGARDATIWDPKSRGPIRVRTTRHAPIDVAVGLQKFRVTPVAVTGRRGLELRWLAPDGIPLKEVLNGRSLVSVLTRHRAIPQAAKDTRRPDWREVGFARVLLCPRERFVVPVPSGGWVNVPDYDADLVLSLKSRELDALITIYWRPDQTWPGPAPSAGIRPKPVAIGGRAGEGWREWTTVATARKRPVSPLAAAGLDTQAGKKTARTEEAPTAAGDGPTASTAKAPAATNKTKNDTTNKTGARRAPAAAPSTAGASTAKTNTGGPSTANAPVGKAPPVPTTSRRIRVVRRARTASGSFVAVLEAPEAMTPPALLDLGHVLRAIQYPR